MSTVARTLPPRDRQRVLRGHGRRRSRAAPRGGSAASAGRSRGRCRGRAARGRCGRSRGRSRRGDAETGSPSTATCFSGRCQPRGRTSSVAIVGRSAGSSLPSGLANVEAAAHGVDQVGLPLDDVRPGRARGQSSKSAMKTSAPELRALIIILRSTGPVISTRPLLQVRGRVGDLPGARPDRLGLGQEVRERAGVELRLPLGPALQELPSHGVELPVELLDEGERPADRMSPAPDGTFARTSIAFAILALPVFRNGRTDYLSSGRRGPARFKKLFRAPPSRNETRKKREYACGGAALPRLPRKETP